MSTPNPTSPWWDIPADPILPGMQAVLRYGRGVIMRATLSHGVWRVDWCGSYPTLNAAAARRGFPPDAGPNADRCARRADGSAYTEPTGDDAGQGYY